MYYRCVQWVEMSMLVQHPLDFVDIFKDKNSRIQLK